MKSKHPFLSTTFLVVAGIALFLVAGAVWQNGKNLRSLAQTLLPDARYRYDERRSGLSGSTDLINMPITPGAVAPPQPKWQFKCPAGIGSSDASVTKDSVYIYCFGTPQTQGLYAFNLDPVIDPTTKQPIPRWKNTLTDARLCGNSAGTFSSDLEIVGNVIYFNVCLKTVAINTTGTYKWSYTHKQYYAPSSVSPPIVGDGRVYISTTKGSDPYSSELLAVSVNSSGVLTAANNLWTYVAPVVTPRIWVQEMTAGLDGKTLFVTQNSATGQLPGNGYIRLINGSDGTPKPGWPITFAFSKAHQLYPPSSLRDGNVYVGTSTGMVYAYEKKSSDPTTTVPAEVWKFQTPDQKAVSPRITLGKKLAIFADNAGWLYALYNDKDLPNNGTQKWRVNYNNNAVGAGSVPNASMTNNSTGVIYIGNYQGQVKAFKAADGKEMWSLLVYDTTSTYRVIREVVVVDGRLYVKNDAGHLRVYKAN